LTPRPSGETRLVDEREATRKAEAARERVGIGVGTLLGSVFVAFVIVAVVVLAARYLF
jgi:hypothetical protein